MMIAFAEYASFCKQFVELAESASLKMERLTRAQVSVSQLGAYIPSKNWSSSLHALQCYEWDLLGAAVLLILLSACSKSTEIGINIRRPMTKKTAPPRRCKEPVRKPGST